jgi:hypothetical protein
MGQRVGLSRNHVAKSSVDRPCIEAFWYNLILGGVFVVLVKIVVFTSLGYIPGLVHLTELTRVLSTQLTECHYRNNKCCKSSVHRLLDHSHGRFGYLEAHGEEDDIGACGPVFAQIPEDANHGCHHEDDIQDVTYLIFAHVSFLLVVKQCLEFVEDEVLAIDGFLTEL